jgi:hypothetical protein
MNGNEEVMVVGWWGEERADAHCRFLIWKKGVAVKWSASRGWMCQMVE